MALVLLAARVLLAAVFATAGIAKLADRGGARRALADFGMPGPLVRPLAPLLVLAELTAAGALLPSRTAPAGAAAALVLLVAFALAIAWNVAQGRAPECHCFGKLHSAPAGWPAVGRNLALAALAGAVLAGAGPGGVALTAVAGALGLALLAAHGLKPSARRALTAGDPAPDFRLENLAGRTVALRELRAGGRPVVLVFTDPGCGPCEALAPALARFQREHGDEVLVALVARGSREANAAKSDEHVFERVLLDPDLRVAASYRAIGTPSAVLVRPDGRVGSPLVQGGSAVEALLERALGGLEPEGARHEALTRLELVTRLAAIPAILSLVLPARAWAGAVPLVIACRHGPVCGGRCCPKTAKCRTRRGKRVCVCPDGRKACGDRCCPPALECRRPRRGKPFCVCPPGTTRCGDRCVSTRSDPSNCGRCGNTCPPATSCVQGACVGGDGTGTGPAGAAPCECPPGQTCCGGACVDLNSNESHCGRCNQPCPEGRSCCDGVCKDLQSDPSNCGECGKRCPAGQVCANGRCGSACPPGQAKCVGRCVDITSDTANCGGCGRNCGERYACCAGSCCSYNAGTCCPDGCKNLALDDDNCGECGNVCGPGSYCRFGICTYPL